jgi:CheY-like chemotaxis protein
MSDAARVGVTRPEKQPLVAGRPRRVLIVDDVRDNADSLAGLLNAMGHEVHAAYGGAEAVEIASAVHPDAVLLDLGMPGVDGYQVCRQLRRQPWGESMLIVALTGWGQETDRARTEDAGFDHHLIKPADLSTLSQLLHTTNGHA